MNSVKKSKHMYRKHVKAVTGGILGKEKIRNNKYVLVAIHCEISIIFSGKMKLKIVRSTQALPLNK